MKKIALVVDVENWAFYNIAKNLKKNLQYYYDIDIIPLSTIDNNLVKFYLYAQKYNLIHFFWRGYINYPRDYSFTAYVEQLGGDAEDFKNNYIKNKIITTSVYDHLFLDDDDGLDITNYILKNSKAYTVSSKILYNIYSKKFKKKPYGVITDGVDLEKFYPINIERFKNIKNRKIIIGWSGNSEWEASKEDFKGVNTIIKPVIKELQDEGYPIEMFFADRKERMIPHDEMVNYYSKIDIYICASKIEGTPNPVLESMACGVPIISTKVGIVPEVFGKNQYKFILEKRNTDCLKNKILDLINNPEKFDTLSKENLDQIKSWTWKEKSMEFKKFFDKYIK